MSEEVKEQVKYDWKELRIAEYARLENEIAIETHELVTDPVRNRLIKEQAMLNAEIEEVEAIYHKNIEAAQQQQAGIKLELAETWSDTEDKTFECDAGTAILRTTKSLHIRSKEKLVAFLELNKKLTLRRYRCYTHPGRQEILQRMEYKSSYETYQAVHLRWDLLGEKVS